MCKSYVSCSAIARRAFKQLLNEGLIERVGEYYASNPLYKGVKAKSKKEKEEEAAAQKGKKGKK